MKKVLMFLALAAVATVDAGAQKFQGGEKNLEVQFAPFGGDAAIKMNGFRFRMFNSESSAIRIGFNVNGGNDQIVKTQANVVTLANNVKFTEPELYETNKNFGFNISAGYEKHFAGTDRLSPYVGGQLGFGMNSQTLTSEFFGAGAVADIGQIDKGVVYEMEKKWGSSTISVMGVAGVDYYFADNFYLGAEINLGIDLTTQKDQETSASNETAFIIACVGADGTGTAEFVADARFNQMNVVEGKANTKTIVGNDNGYKSNVWGPNSIATGSIRLGWLF